MGLPAISRRTFRGKRVGGEPGGNYTKRLKQSFSPLRRDGMVEIKYHRKWPPKGVCHEKRGLCRALWDCLRLPTPGGVAQMVRATDS